MRTINKRIKAQNLKVKYFYDEETPKGYPTKDSFVVTVVYQEDDDKYVVGYSFKVPGDEFIPKIGKAIAYRNLMNQQVVVSKHESDVLDLFGNYLLYCHDTNRKLSKNLKMRIAFSYIIERERN
jgi:hypothetical protein